MTARALRTSPLSVAVALVVVAVAVVGFLLTKGNADQQGQRLLRDETALAALSASPQFDSIVSSVTGIVAPVARYDPGSLQATVSAIAGATSSAHFAVDVFQRSTFGFVAVAAAGPGPRPGQLAGGTLQTALADAQSAKSAPGSISSPYVPSPVVRRGDNSTVGFATVVAPGSNEVVYFSFTIDPFTAAGTLVQNKGPFELLRLVLYGSARPSSGSVIIATTHSLPLTGNVSTKKFSVGTRQWLLVAQARSPLAGSFARAAPWVILALGIFLALLLAGIVEILVRRQRYANDLVAKRTGELEVSLAELREAQDKLVRGERLAALGEMASVVGHELRNPLTAVMNALFLLRRGAGEVSESSTKHLDMAERETAKAAALAEDLTAFVRPRTPVLAEVDLADVVREVIQATPPPEAVDLAVETSPLTVVADRNQLTEVLANLVTNAYQAIPGGGSVRVSAGANGTGALIVVEDSGQGIDEELAQRIFEPFFTTKPTGTGLGLAIVRRLVEAHGGEISIENNSDHGARVTVRLPRDGGRAGETHVGDRRAAERRTGGDRRDRRSPTSSSS